MKKLKGNLRLISYLMPFFLLLFFVVKFSVNVPFNDEWSLVDFFGKLQSNTLNFADLWSLHNDHRMVFPKLIFIIVGITTHWNVTIEMYLSVFFTGLTCYLILKISDNNSTKNKLFTYLSNLITTILIFSLIQIENWLWGFQVAWLWINLWLMFAIFILTLPKNFNSKYKILLAALSCFIASFSSAHGLFTWLAMFPCIFMLETEKKKKLSNLVIWLIIFIICTFIYLNGYHKPAAHPETISIFSQSLITINYFFTLIGNSLFFPKYNNTVIIGLIIFLTFLAFNLLFIISIFKNKNQFLQEIVPWISLSWFAIIFAVVTTLARAGFGVNHALASRYTTVSILLLIACLQLTKVVINTHWQWFKIKLYRYSSVYFIIGFLLFLTTYNSLSFFKVGYAYSLERNYGKTCLEIIDFFDESHQEKYSDKSCFDYLANFDTLNNLPDNFKALGWINFQKDIDFVENTNLIYGKITNQTKTNDNNIVKGWAILPQSNIKPDAILVSVDDNKSFLTNAIMTSNSSNQKVEWKVNISNKILPQKNSLIKIWVYDNKNKQFIRLYS